MLPKPSGSFEWRRLPAGPALVCRPLDRATDHLFTSRSWTLGAPTADPLLAWSAVADGAGVPPANLRRLKQVHGADAVIADRRDTVTTLPLADIILSVDPELAIAVQAADCVPLLFADLRTGAVAAAHAGWRGLAAGVPRFAVAALRAAFGSHPADLTVAIGPSIGACCYEVGDEVRARFDEIFEGNGADKWFAAAPAVIAGNPPFRNVVPSPGKWFFDGWQSARDQLETAGIPAGHIHVAGLCTASHTELCSYRRDGAAAGRIAAVIRVKQRSGK